MKRWVLLLVVLLAIPAFSLGVSRAVANSYENEWRAVLVREIGADEATRMPTIAQVCDTSEGASAFGAACRDLTIFAWMEKGAGLTGAVSIGLVVLIALAGQLARYHRNLLMALFGPGLRLTIVILLVLILVEAVLAMLALYFGEAALFERVHTLLIALTGVGALSGAWAMSKAALVTVQKLSARVVGVALPRDAQPGLWQFVTDLAARVGTAPPDYIVAGLLPTFFVTEAEVECSGVRLKGRTLFLSPAACRILSRGELAAVVGHELGHFRGQDTAFTRRFYPIYRGAQAGLVALLQNGGGARSLALWPAFHLLSFFLHAFAGAESALSRQRELAADQSGAEVAGALPMAAALGKLHAFAGVWEQVQREMQQELAQDRKVENAALHYAMAVQESAGSAVLEGLDQKWVRHPFDSHPPLGQRLEALNMSLDGIREAVLQVAPPDSAASLFSHTSELEAGLTELQIELLAATNQVRAAAALQA